MMVLFFFFKNKTKNKIKKKEKKNQNKTKKGKKPKRKKQKEKKPKPKPKKTNDVSVAGWLMRVDTKPVMTQSSLEENGEITQIIYRTSGLRGDRFIKDKTKIPTPKPPVIKDWFGFLKFKMH
jgi:hypothetical protein